MHVHAMANLRFIRETMESAGSFTAVSGIGQLAIAATALMACAVASRQSQPRGFVLTWVVEAIVAVLIAGWSITWKAMRRGFPLGSAVTRKFLCCFAPPLVAGAILTPVIYRAGAAAALPGTWLLLFGTAVATGGAMSVKIVPLMGYVFMALGGVALAAPSAWGNALMAVGFGGVMALFGAVVARRHGG